MVIGLKLKNAVACFLAAALALPAFPAQDAPAPLKLNLVIVEGDGAINNVRQRVAREPIVQVTDENNKPVAGAVIVALLPQNGASGTFLNGSQSFTAVTDANGRATIRGIRSNNLQGKFEVRVSASFKGVNASNSFSMINAPKVGGGAFGGGAGAVKPWVWVAVIGGVAAGAAVGATQVGTTSVPPPGPTPQPPTVVVPGAPTVGPPR